MAVKRDGLPALQLYPGDWRKDPGVQALTFEQRGIWFEMLMVMHESERRGALVLNGKPMNEGQIARVIGCESRKFNAALQVILDSGVGSKDDTGAVINRRMVKDEHIRQIRKQAGKLGGNPNLVGSLDNQTEGQTGDLLNQSDNQTATPSSSTSVSSSTAVEKHLSGKPDACPHQKVIELYHASLPLNPRIAAWTDARAQTLRTRWREKQQQHAWKSEADGLDFFERFFKYVGESHFLTGRAPGRGDQPAFVANLEWLLKPANFVKVIEGKYHQ